MKTERAWMALPQLLMIVMMTIAIIIIIIIMDFVLGCTLSAGNSPLSALTKVKKWLMISMDHQYEMAWKFL
jgi:cell division protein FtsX